MTIQLVTRLDEALIEGLDALVESGGAANRSDGVRRAVTELLRREARAERQRADQAAYIAMPQTDEELATAHAATLAMIAEEPW